MSMWARTLLFALLAVIGPSSDAKGYSHHYSHHYSHGRYRGPSRHTYRSSYGRAYFHGATHYWVTVLGFRYLYGTRNFNDCDQGQTCEWQQGCCHQEMSATVVTATASIVVDEKQSLPAFSPAYIPSPLSKELVRDARSTLAAHGVDIDEKLFVVAMLSPRTVTARRFRPRTCEDRYWTPPEFSRPTSPVAVGRRNSHLGGTRPNSYLGGLPSLPLALP